MDHQPVLPIIFGIPGLEIEKEWADFFQRVSPFGFILFARNLKEPKQIKRLVQQFHEVCDRDEVAILIDEEGGRVQRLPQPNWIKYPAAKSLVDEGGKENEITKRIGQNYFDLGQGLQELGITVNAAPVADIWIPEAHDVIGDRAFSSQPEEVATYARACAEGLGQAGVIPTVKHLPGYGRASVDPHHELPVVRESEKILIQSDFLPFKLLADLPWGMTSHLLFPALDEQWPATLSEKIIGRIIRKWIGFDGLLVTDCLFMEALSGSIPERVQRCLTSGCDVALHSHGELADLEIAVESLQPINDLSWERWENSLEWVKERTTL